MPTLIRKIANYIKSPEYRVDVDVDDSGEECITVSSVIQVNEELIPCDVMIDLVTNQATGTKYVRFTTFIAEGMEGKNIDGLYRFTDILTYDFRGKLMYDYTDKSRDLLYCTYENEKAVIKKVVMENIEHHIYVKALLENAVDNLSQQLGLQPKTGAKQSKFEFQATELAKKLLSDGVNIVEVKPED